MTDGKRNRAKRVLFAISAAVVVLLFVLLTGFFLTHIKEMTDAESFRAFLAGYGAKAWLVGLCVQILQVFIALIPGEAVEIGLGYAFGAAVGTLLCYAGVAAATCMIFVLVRKFGKAVTELYADEKDGKVRKFLEKHGKNTEKLRRLAFLLFIIPGTPKDLLVYLFAASGIRLAAFLPISLIARFPSVISSTVGGMFIHNGQIKEAVVLFAATAVVSTLGWLIFEKMTQNKEKTRKDCKISKNP